MSRYLLILIALLSIATLAQAGEQTTPRGIVMGYECKQIDPTITGFSCEFDSGELVLQYHERPSDMSQERRELSMYESTKIAMRFFELGGKSFEIKRDFWAPNQRSHCSVGKGRPYYDYGCYDYTIKE